MLLSGFTFIRNAVKYDFPIRECIESMLPIVDELVVNIGESGDETEKLVASIASPKIRIVRSVWDDSKTDRGLVLSEQTNIALEACQGRWALYLQADEALHESEHAAIRAAVEAADRESDPVDGLRLRYLHFYGGYTLVQRTWNWYPSEIRVVRRASGARSFGDAQTFRMGERSGHAELRTRLLDAHVFHYGHARAPETMKRKITYFHRFWHGDNHDIAVRDAYSLDWKNLVWYWGTHPAPYRERVAAGSQWSPHPSQLAKQPFSRIRIIAEGATVALADELHTLLAEARPSLLIEVNPTLSKDFEGGTALVDLAAESRGQVASVMFAAWLRRSGPYAWRVAYAPHGSLSALRARRYDVVSWGCHETWEQGFQVPERDRARQLLRWLGIDSEGADQKR